jgi:Uma2 family endonuclease
MDPSNSGVKLTYDDFVHFPDDGLRHELIDGEHYVTASPNLRHQRILSTLYYLIRSRIETHPVGEVFLSPLDVVFSRFDVVEPDLLYVSRERAHILTPHNVQGTPDLVIEIGSPSTRQRDDTVKRQLYERAGVPEYWFADPDRDVIRVYRRTDNRFAGVLELSREREDTLTTPLLPGLELQLTRIFGA